MDRSVSICSRLLRLTRPLVSVLSVSAPACRSAHKASASKAAFCQWFQRHFEACDRDRLASRVFHLNKFIERKSDGPEEQRQQWAAVPCVFVVRLLPDLVHSFFPPSPEGIVCPSASTCSTRRTRVACRRAMSKPS